jgi:hypothetical protein
MPCSRAGKRKAAKKGKRTAPRDPLPAAAVQRRSAVQQSVAKVPKRRAGWLDVAVPPKMRRHLRYALLCIAVTVIISYIIMLALQQRPPNGPIPPPRVPPPT